MTLNLGYVASLGITMALFLIVLAVQLRADRYRAALY